MASSLTHAMSSTSSLNGPPLDMASMRSTLTFFVNGRKVEDSNVEPDMTLIKYLRSKLGMNGTKLGCSEGGCGACTVMLSHFDRNTQRIVHRSVNACLTPVCAVDNMAVTTIEGIGSSKTRLHPVQERMALAHGSQCGFCTPGIVMSMYTLLRNNPEPTLEEIENAFDGNLCRCTGYRPILSGFKTFAKESCCKGPGKDGKCCMETEDSSPLVKRELFDATKFAPFDPTQEPIFPSELSLLAKKADTSLRIEGQHVTWYTPTQLSELLELKAAHPHAKIVVGNTEIGIETKFKNFHYKTLITPIRVPELATITESDTGITIGSSVTLADIETYLSSYVKRAAASKTQNFTAMLENLRWFAGKQIRNVASLAGNIATASPISDMNPILVAAGASLTVQSVKNGVRTIPLKEFFLSYRKTALHHDEVVLSIFVPFTRPNEYTEAFKQARRRDDDIAIVNACLRVLLDTGAGAGARPTVKEIHIAYGGVAATVLQAKKTEAALVGRVWDDTIVDEAMKHLEHEIVIEPTTPGGQAEYRRSLASSFFFKFYLMVLAHVDAKALGERDQSAIERVHHKPSESCQSFEAPLVGKGGVDRVGQPEVHLSAIKQACGEAVYTDDIPRFANELYGALVLSKRAHAQITEIDTAAALAMPGVHGFFCEKDVPGKNYIYVAGKADDRCFSSKEVNSMGAFVGIIVADTQEHAQAAAKAVKITYVDLPAIITIEDAVKAKSFHVPPVIIAKGSLEEGFKAADHVLEGEMRMGGQEHFYLETQACICVPRNEDGEMEIFSSTQNPTKTQMTVASVLGVPASRINCRVKRMGGGFGGKESRSIFLASALAVAAHHTGRPVRCQLDRDEDMATSGGRHPFHGKWKVGFKKTGEITALEVDMFSNAGETLDLSGSVMERAIFHMTNSYRIPNIRGMGYVCNTNLASNTAFRGFGGPQGMMFAENWISDVARVTGLSQDRVREINFFKEGDKTHYNQTVEDEQISSCWSFVKRTAKYEERLKEVAEFNSKNRYKKRGVAMVPTMFGISFTATFLNQSSALVHVYTDGSVLVTHGGTEMGQGLHTKMVQVAARAFGIAMEDVHITETSTNTVANQSPTAASASSDLYGMAILNACDQIKSRMAPYREKNPTGTWKQWVSAAYFDRACLSATGHYKTPDLGYDFQKNEGRPFNYYNFGAACAEVEIDTLTGDHEVRRVDICMDVGASLNPAIDIGQVEGAFVQGQGLVTLEQKIYLPDGRDFTLGPGTYKIPGFKDIARDMRVHLLRNAPNSKAVHSSKAVGEPPLFLGASVFYAIKEAVIAARAEEGIDPSVPFRFDSPATSERIRMACTDRFTKQFPAPTGDVKRWNVEV